MSTENAAPAAGAESQTSIPNTPTAQADKPAPAATPAIPPGLELIDPKKPPQWFSERIERAETKAREKLLQDLGIDDPVKAKEAIEKAKAEEEKQKTVAQKLAEREAELKTERDRRTALEQAVTVQAQDAMRVLTPEQQAVVRDLAGDDPARQVQVIAKLRPTWGTGAPAAAQGNSAPAALTTPATPAAQAPAVHPTAPAPIPAGATTASPGAAPPAPNSQQPKDHKAIYEDMKKYHPVKAARYMAKHFAEIHKQ